MNMLARLLLVFLLACNLSACGNKGKLKTPTEIQRDEARKAKEAAKKQKEQENNTDDAVPLPATAPPPATPE